eukprot:4583718-Pyramimonas_sp.AAC.1
MERPGRNPGWARKLQAATASSMTSRTAFARTLLSALATSRGLTCATPWNSPPPPARPGDPSGIKRGRLTFKSGANS